MVVSVCVAWCRRLAVAARRGLREARAIAAHPSDRQRRLIYFVVVGAIPAIVISLGVARFMLTHFYSRAPYLLDSGLLSGITYRSGLLLAPPTIACDYATSFHEVYFSPLIALFSLLSYLVPLNRIDWFALVEAMHYLPLGFAVYLVASRTAPRVSLRRMPLTLLTACAFALSGMVLWTVSYPHYEVATSALACLVVACVVTGRTRLTWLCLVLAAGVRQDGGLHVAAALMPLLFLTWRRFALPVTRRRILLVIAVAIGASVVTFAAQRLLFTPADRLTDVYLGRPAYAHVTTTLLAERWDLFLSYCQTLYYPFIASVLIALLRRDARYLLGWAACVPWFLFNFLAHDAAKATFTAYVIGPFICAVFWVFIYGSLLAPASRRLPSSVMELLLVLACASSTLGYYRGAPWSFTTVVRDMASSRTYDRVKLARFVDAIGTRKSELGKVYVDYAIAALALEHFRLGEQWGPHITDADTLLLHARISDSALGSTSQHQYVRNQINYCTFVLGTHFRACTRTPLPHDFFGGLPTETVFSSFSIARRDRKRVRASTDGTLVIDAPYRWEERLGTLGHGHYEWRVHVEPLTPSVDGSPLGTLRLFDDERSVLPAVTLPAAGGDVTLDFARKAGDTTVRFVLVASRPLRITNARLVVRD